MAYHLFLETCAKLRIYRPRWFVRFTHYFPWTSLKVLQSGCQCDKMQVQDKTCFWDVFDSWMLNPADPSTKKTITWSNHLVDNIFGDVFCHLWPKMLELRHVYWVIHSRKEKNVKVIILFDHLLAIYYELKARPIHPSLSTIWLLALLHSANESHHSRHRYS